MGNKISHEVRIFFNKNRSSKTGYNPWELKHSKNSNIDGVPGIFTISTTNKPPEHGPVEAHESDVKNLNPHPERDQWGSGTQFLMSCIAFSVGLGNVWRFPNTAYENGGGAFLIPYLVVLFIIGKPFYYMEMVLGQFTSRSCIEIWSISPAFRGIGYGVTISVFSVVTYYCALMALTLYYLIASFSSPLPWTFCTEEWGSVCFDATTSGKSVNRTSTNFTPSSSAELYFRKSVLNEAGIENGVGVPSVRLVLCLLGSWIAVYIVVSQGVRSTGKASYFLALFPYVIMISLLVRAVTLDGAVDGIAFLYQPDWSKILDPSVWYAAVTQAFFSLGVCFGGVTMYSSYNNFSHNVARDCIIVTTLDLATSLIAGTTIFGILGNLAHEIGSDDISRVVRSGAGLAFISYPEALAKFSFAPQFFSVLFFLMLFVLGVGSAVAFSSVVISVIADQFPKVKRWKVAAGVSVVGFLVGTVYCTPGGQYVLNLVDFFGGTFIIVFLASFEVIAISWVYGIENFLDDIEFMVGKRPSIYWRCCWACLTPLTLFIILMYFLATLGPLTYNGEYYPTAANAAGWGLLALGIVPFPILMLVELFCKRTKSISQCFKATADWGPKDPKIREEWRIFKDAKNHDRSSAWRVDKMTTVFGALFDKKPA